MKCTNCDQSPLGIIDIFKTGGVSGDDYFAGYFRCRHCNTLHKQKRIMNIIPMYEWKVWPLFILIVAGVYLIPEWLFSWLYNSFLNLTVQTEVLISSGVFLFLVAAAFWTVLTLMLKSQKIEQADESELNINKRLTRKGWGMFLTYVAATLLSGYYLISISGSAINQLMIFEMALVVYVLLVLLTGAWILNEFSESEEIS